MANETSDRDRQLTAEVERLQREVQECRQIISDLQIALTTTAEHGDVMEEQLHQANQKLRAEISERQMAQATLQNILETVSRDKADLELILKATAEHGDTVEYQLYTQAVETMRQSEELFRAISESTSILMILTQQPNGAIAYANSASGSFLGIEIPVLVGQPLCNFFAEPADYQYIQQQVQQQGFVHNYEMQVKRSNGQPFWVSASVHPLQFGGQSTLLTTLYDISDRKAAESALRESEEKLRQQALELEQRVEQRTAELRKAEEKYRSIFENAAEGIFQVTEAGQYLSVNPALAKLYGYESPEALMQGLTSVKQQLYVQPRRWEELMAYLKGFPEVEGFESQVRRKDGTMIWISENVRVVRDEAGQLLCYEGSVRDITDRKTTEAELRLQRLRSERLLLNVLPQAIAERLKRGEKTIADRFTNATVLFADIANFTHLSAQIPATELIGLLNNVFSAFDELADQYGLEKIKTIGDAYMVVGGVPNPMPDHTEAIANMALDLQQTVSQYFLQDGQPILLRMGIHTGPVIAGVIGTRKFNYDLWGNTVNVASRMEAQGEPGRIQVTEAVYERLKSQYEFEARGAIDIRGKGVMYTYWLTGHKAEA
ncbi:adenylate/guanylate cyclase domain-containing protein [Leptolyngbya sp. AN02str]|uniref:adenylate/guanylate cyclase domain-containing protein n=1 Tax=Leptolyngbya sp. AN02str TaxID=3423363 RepID=UPI003D31DD7D